MGLSGVNERPLLYGLSLPVGCGTCGRDKTSASLDTDGHPTPDSRTVPACDGIVSILFSKILLRYLPVCFLVRSGIGASSEPWVEVIT